MSFKSLGLNDALLKAVRKQGYENPSPIQEKAIPLILEGKDVLASAQTGTGKTAGFTLPILQILSETKKPNKRPIRALILAPTRELAAQVHKNVVDYSKFLDIKSAVIFGGVNAKPQIRALKYGVDILVATPGRLLDLLDQRALSLGRLDILVLDEADRMLDMGFLRDIKKIISLMPERRQNLMFSATFSKEIKKLAEGILHRPISVETAPQNTTAETVDQKAYRVDRESKIELTIKLISDGNWKQVLIFTRTKHRANKLSEKLVKAGITSAAIHGNKSQGARTKALDYFKSGKIRVLVATDIAARGLDIPLLPHVINFELPNVPEDYVHRIGRTGRAGADGQAISLVDIDEVEYVRSIEKLLGQKLETEVVEGFEPTNKPSENKPKQQNRRTSRKPRSQGQGNSNKTKSSSGSKKRSSNNRRRR
ncbi:DEAD/DEAH box helicase [Urechidicola croceus]|uniref:DEAD-box ATP-dependent RNA helicase RhpA n=1 Tax=Urechidicola croceus TaxID=1850246 RepID=A0A1D8PAC1_9FLAO|nr:DEAD/DEAH box helicase [Urechidicola croceus]AOW21500.1 ATP-dependent RNA helicase RhlE [Urechidicola croceus]